MTFRAQASVVIMLCALAPGPAAWAQTPQAFSARQALAGHFVRHAVAFCGYEASPEGAALSTAGFGAGQDRDRQFAHMLWHGTFACKKAYIGTSCMAARWSLCQRTFAEYGPDGALIPGLLKPIIHK